MSVRKGITEPQSRVTRESSLNPERILIVAPSWIGDTILAQPLLTLLKQRAPGARIDVLAPAWSSPLLARMAEVDRALDNPFAHGEFNFSARRALGQRLRVEAYDQAYVLPNSWKSALLPFFARIPRRIGYHGESRWGLLTERHRLDTEAHPQLVQRYAALAGALPAALPRPRLNSSPAQQQAVRQALELPLDATPIVFCPGAEYGPAKRWPIEHFAALARQLKLSRGETGRPSGRRCPEEGMASSAAGTAPVWIVGSAKDAPVGQEIEALAQGGALNLCGRSSLEQAIDLIASARAVVSNDSGLMHVAAALGRPLVALYGSSSPEYTPPCSDNSVILTRRLDCSPCFKRDCPLGHFDCMKGLQPEQVFAQLERLASSAEELV